MKRMLIAGALALVAGGRAFAADLPQPAPPAPRAPAAYVPASAPVLVYNWSGIYVGINGGIGFSSSNWIGAGGLTTGPFNPGGFHAGGTIGANYQWGAFVFGLEADGDWTNLYGTSAVASCGAAGGPAGASCETKSDWVGTARARVGYAFERVLFYGTGGAAFGNIQAGYNPPSTFDSATNFGWTAGAGFEYAIAQNWSAKLEFLYVDLGKMSCTVNCGGVPITVPLTEALVRFGVNFKFGPW